MPPFFFALQSALETAAVDVNPELLLNRLHTPHSRQGGVCGPQGPDMLQDFLGQLVAGLRAALLRKQPGETALGKGDLRVIERWPRHAECNGCIDDRLSFDEMASKRQHIGQVSRKRSL